MWDTIYNATFSEEISQGLVKSEALEEAN
jgi:hypothetical protein